MSEQAAETPLIELARSVPKDLRAEWPSQWWEDGTPCGHTMAPVGRYLHELADMVERLQSAINEAMDIYTDLTDDRAAEYMYDRLGEDCTDDPVLARRAQPRQEQKCISPT